MIERDQPVPNYLGNLAFSRDGRLLYCSIEGEEAGAGTILTVSVASWRRNLLYGYSVNKTYYSLDQPAVSPSGTKIAAFSDSMATMRSDGSYDDDDKGAGIVIMTAACGHSQHIKSGTFDSSLVWSSDESRYSIAPTAASKASMCIQARATASINFLYLTSHENPQVLHLTTHLRGG